MDELRIKTNFMKGMICRLIRFTVKKSLGCDVDLDLKDLNVVSDGDKIHIQLNAEAVVEADDVEKILKEKLW